MSFLGYYDDIASSSSSSDDVLHNIIPSDEEDSETSLGMTIVSSAPSFEEEIVFEWPGSQQQSEATHQQQQHIPMSISTHESMSLTPLSEQEQWILTSSPQDMMCLIIPRDDESNIGDDSELSFHPSSVPSSDISQDLWTGCSASSSSSSHKDDSNPSSQQQSHVDDDDPSWEHIHRVHHDDDGVYLQTTSSNSIVTAPWSSWYEKLSTEEEWEDMKARIQDILLALTPHDLQSADELLALWIEQEEELFWNPKKKQPQQPYRYWGEVVAVAATVASFGVFFLRRY